MRPGKRAAEKKLVRGKISTKTCCDTESAEQALKTKGYYGRVPSLVLGEDDARTIQRKSELSSFPLILEKIHSIPDHTVVQMKKWECLARGTLIEVREILSEDAHGNFLEVQCACGSLCVNHFEIYFLCVPRMTHPRTHTLPSRTSGNKHYKKAAQGQVDAPTPTQTHVIRDTNFRLCVSLFFLLQRILLRKKRKMGGKKRSRARLARTRAPNALRLVALNAK